VTSSDGSDRDPIPWDELSEGERRRFAAMLNRRFDASLSIDQAAEYYGNPTKVKDKLGDIQTERSTGGPECPHCFDPLYKDDIPHLKKTGRCPNCGEVLSS